MPVRLLDDLLAAFGAGVPTARAGAPARASEGELPGYTGGGGMPERAAGLLDGAGGKRDLDAEVNGRVQRSWVPTSSHSAAAINFSFTFNRTDQAKGGFQMATFIVTSNQDGDAGSELSLREAIAAANATEGTDVIEFDIGAFSGGDANTIRLVREFGTLLITDSVVIDATRVAGVTITGDASNNDVTTEDGITDIEMTARADLLDNIRPMAITGDNEETLLRGLTLTGGYVRIAADPQQSSPGVPGAGFNAWSGGGLFVDEGSVTFEFGAVSGNAVERDNEASRFNNVSAGGIFFRETVNPFDPEPQFDILRVIRSSVEGNHVFGDGTGAGGGIYAFFLQLEDSTVANNSTEGSFGDGGGVALGYDGTLRNATVYGNVTKGDGANGGGIWAPNNLEILNSTIVANRVEGERSQGGGVVGYGGSVESTIGGDEKRFANSIILGNVSVDAASTNDLALSPYGPTAEGRDENTFDGVNIIGDIYNIRPELTTINGPILNRNIGAIFENGGELKDNGGEVKTVKLRDSASNPAIDGSGEGALDADAIGRPAQDWPGRGNEAELPGVRDLGAHELPFLTGGLPDIERGTEGDETLGGTDRDDVFLAGDGQDTITGGGGADVFAFRPGGDPATLTDFDSRAGDRLAFDDRFFGLGGADIDPRGVTQAQARGALDAGKVIYDRTTGELFVDGDGVRGSDTPALVAVLENGAGFTYEDVLLF